MRYLFLGLSLPLLVAVAYEPIDWLAPPVLVFEAGRDHVPGHADGVGPKGIKGTDTYQCNREPVVVKTNSGRLVALIHAGNRHSWPERSGQDFVIATSDDGGITWSNPTLAGEHGNYSMQSHGLVYDAERDRLLCLYTVYRWDYSVVKGRGVKATAPVMAAQVAKGEPLQKQYLIYSDNGGQTWSEPRDISEMMPDGGNGHFGASEGRQITEGPFKGRLLLPGGCRAEDEKGAVTKKLLGVWYSDDHGESWKLGRPVLETTETRNFSCEARVTELPGGSLLYNVRTRNTGRQQARSTDGGTTWTKLIRKNELEASQCNGSLLTVQDADGKLTDTVLLSVPSPGGRNNGYLYVSRDGGKTWPLRHHVAAGAFAYSALVQVDAATVGLLWESGHYKNIAYARLPLARVAPWTSGNFVWEELPKIPDALGVAGGLVGVHNDALIVAGGANFPAGKGEDLWEVPKVWHDRIYVLPKNDSKANWIDAGKLSKANGYSACVSTPYGVFCGGGNDGPVTFDDAFLLTWDAASKKVHEKPLPKMPAACAGGSAAVVGDMVYVAGGLQGNGLGTAMQNFWRLDLSKLGTAACKWDVLPMWNGKARTNAPLVYLADEGALYMVGGRWKLDGIEGLAGIHASTELHRFDLKSGKWEQKAALPIPASSRTAWAVSGSGLGIFGGSDGSILKKRVSMPDLVKRHPGFPLRGQLYDAKTDRWEIGPPMPANHATVPAALWGEYAIIASGEVRPRVRTRTVWRIKRGE